MKTALLVICASLLLVGIFAGVAYPSYTRTVVMADGTGPIPLCAPGDKGCKVNPIIFPQPDAPNGGGSSLRADGTGPIPLCAPGDKGCKVNPIIFPQPDAPNGGGTNS